MAQRQTLNQLKPQYDRLRALTDSDLPAWGSLIDWARAHPKDAAADGAWDGWLTRLAACLARRSESNGWSRPRRPPSWI